MLIQKGTTNTIALTLNEKREETDSEFIIKFFNSFTGASKVLGLTDVSDYKDRANIFNITENDTENLSHSVVKLEPTGKWEYTVYEMAESSPRNLDPDDAIGEVETGICIVWSGSESQVKTFSVDEDKNTPVFDED
jgi:hypothetical protein